jgi:predicted nucleic acid-binding protein
VINTSPLIALVAALGDLNILKQLYEEVWVSWEVRQEILAGGSTGLAITQFEEATWLIKQTAPLKIFPFLLNSLDLGEASVIQLAINQRIQTVCIDEAVGRRIARLNGLSVTGSVGILLKAKQCDPSLSIQTAIENMLSHNIRLSQRVIDFVLQEAGESDDNSI